MEKEEILAQLTSFLRQYYLPVGLFTLGLIFFGYGLIQYFNSNATRENIDFHEAKVSITGIAPTFNEANLAIDIEGAVVKPGVYKLAADARIQDALLVAGGLAANADRTWVAKHLNLATKIVDGMKIYIPSQGEAAAAIVGGQDSIEGAGLIDLNTASSSELDSLTGVGQVTVAKIINARPYTSINDLLSRKIVSSKVFAEIKDKITAN